MEPSSGKIHAALLSSPGTGHLIPIIELGKRLVRDHGFDVTVFVLGSEESNRDSDIIESSMTPKLLDIVKLPPVDISTMVGPDASLVTLLAVMMRAAVPTFRSALTAMEARPNVLIVDLFGVEHLVIGDELKIPKFVYLPTSAWSLASVIYTPTWDKEIKGEYVEQIEPLKIPGCRSVRPEDVHDPMLDRTKQEYIEYLQFCEKVPMADGILVNTWEDLQPKALAALRDNDLLGRFAGVPIYAIGPLVRPKEKFRCGDKLLDWLDKQPRESVIFVSFGSGGTLSSDQLTELAWGLELSRQRFIWVITPPTATTGVGSYVSTGNNDGAGDFSGILPEGFSTRVQGMGFLVPTWAPQIDILEHPSIGGFLSHCGWSSILESIMNGVPMIAWPLYAEQRMNATLLTEEIRVAVRPKVLPTRGKIGREEIKALVRTIMVEEEGRGIRAKAKELKEGAERALTVGGGSYESLAKLAQDCRRRLYKTTLP